MVRTAHCRAARRRLPIGVAPPPSAERCGECSRPQPHRAGRQARGTPPPCSTIPTPNPRHEFSLHLGNPGGQGHPTPRRLAFENGDRSILHQNRRQPHALRPVPHSMPRALQGTPRDDPRPRSPPPGLRECSEAPRQRSPGPCRSDAVPHSPSLSQCPASAASTARRAAARSASAVCSGLRERRPPGVSARRRDNRVRPTRHVQDSGTASGQSVAFCFNAALISCEPVRVRKHP